MKISVALSKPSQGDGERELIEAFARRFEPPAAGETCPSRDLVEQFAAGRLRDVKAQNLVLGHLSGCKGCMSVILAARGKSSTDINRKPRHRIGRLPLALAATVLLAVVLLVWHNRDRLNHVEVVVLDLRSDVMRSTGTPFKVGHQKTHLAVKLPAGSVAGIYQLELLKGEPSTTVLRGSAPAQVRTNGDVELEIDLNFARVETGHYILAVWQDDANPRYQPLLVE